MKICSKQREEEEEKKKVSQMYTCTALTHIHGKCGSDAHRNKKDNQVERIKGEKKQ